MAKVTYEGPTKRDAPETVFYLDGQRFDKGAEVEVTDEELIAELREGSERLKGQKFTVASEARATNPKAKE